MRRFRPGVWPSLLTAVGLAILVSLGIWQVQRLDWKTDLLATIETRMDAAPVPLPAEIKDPAGWAYRPVQVTGRFDHGREAYVFAARQRIGGWFVYTPLIRESGPPVMINRGFVPEDKLAPQTRPDSLDAGPVTVIGLARTARTGNAFTPPAEPDARRFYVADLDAMAAALGLQRWAPIIVDARKGPAESVPVGGQTRLDIPNNHLQYALTWFGLALVLLAIYLAYGFRKLSD